MKQIGRFARKTSPMEHAIRVCAGKKGMSVITIPMNQARAKLSRVGNQTSRAMMWSPNHRCKTPPRSFRRENPERFNRRIVHLKAMAVEPTQGRTMAAGVNARRLAGLMGTQDIRHTRRRIKPEVRWDYGSFRSPRGAF